MSFQAKAFILPAAGLNSMKQARNLSLGFVDPFLTQQEAARPATLGCGPDCDCPRCQRGMGGNWYFYPENQRGMYGLGGLFDKTLINIPVINKSITTGHVAALAGVAGLLYWIKKRS